MGLSYGPPSDLVTTPLNLEHVSILSALVVTYFFVGDDVMLHEGRQAL